MSDSIIYINNKPYNVVRDGVEKVCKDSKVGVIIGARQNQYWTNDVTVEKDIQMLFHPKIIKIVLEGGFESVRANINWLQELGINTIGFNNYTLLELKVEWIEAGTKFNIVYDENREKIITYPNKCIIA